MWGIMLQAGLVFASTGLDVRVQACAEAVRADREEAKELCKATPEALWGKDAQSNVSPHCRKAMAAGLNTRKVPPRLRPVMLKRFEEAMAVCQNPPAKKKVQTRDVTNIWD